MSAQLISAQAFNFRAILLFHHIHESRSDDMIEQELTPNSDRGLLLYRWRMTLGWDAARAAALLGVSSRTIGLWETLAQPLPDARWRLFLHEVIAEVNKVSKLVVVIANDGLTPIEVVSDSNFAGLVISEDGKTALIASYAIDRQSGQPRLHRQKFVVAENRHVINATALWESERQIPNDHRAAFEMQRWLTRRVLDGELANPKLAKLKETINAAKVAVDEAVDANEEIRAERIRALDQAVAALIHEVGTSTRELD